MSKKSAGYWVAVGFGAGHIPWIAGTTGTIPFWLLLFLWTRFTQPAVVWMAIVSLVVTAVGLWAASKAEEEIGRHDPKQIVIDEWAGMAISLIGVPPRLSSYCVAFVLFRIFDVVKPPPSRQLEKLPGGYGIVLDDVFAGFYALVVYHLLHRFLPSLL